MILRSLKTGGSERVTLILENGEEIASTLGVITELRLYAGKDLTDAELKLLREKTAAAAARNHALLLLSQRPHSQKELYDKLVRKGESTEAAEAAVAWLADHGYLDDAAYAASVVRTEGLRCPAHPRRASPPRCAAGAVGRGAARDIRTRRSDLPFSAKPPEGPGGPERSAEAQRRSAPARLFLGGYPRGVSAI